MSLSADLYNYLAAQFPIGCVVDLVRYLSFCDRATSAQTVRVPLINLKNSAGTTLLSTSPGSTDFTINSTPGTSENLTGHAAQNNTKTDNAIFEFILGNGYIAGANITLTVFGKYALSSGTTITASLTATAYKMADDGTAGSNLIATAAATPTTTAADMAFVITGTNLSPGDRILVKLASSVQEAGNTGTATATIYSVRYA